MKWHTSKDGQHEWAYRESKAAQERKAMWMRARGALAAVLAGFLLGWEPLAFLFLVCVYVLFAIIFPRLWCFIGFHNTYGCFASDRQDDFRFSFRCHREGCDYCDSF